MEMREERKKFVHIPFLLLVVLIVWFSFSAVEVYAEQNWKS